MKTTIISVVLLASLSTTEAGIGMGVLMIWPSARSTALAGAMTGLADEADATYFNPAGLAFQTTAKADISYGNWLPGLYGGMYYASAAGGTPLHLPFLRGHNAFIAGSLTYLNLGETNIVNERGEYLGRFVAWRGTIAAAVAAELAEHLAVGLQAKCIRSYVVPEWFWKYMPELGMDMGGTGNAWACDAGVLWKPLPRFSVGVSVDNIGPGITYASSGEHDLSPAMLRLGACWTPVNNRFVRVNVLPEFDKLLVGMFFDTAGTKTFERELREELRDAWKSFGVEVTGFELLTVRLGYFEDHAWQRGGLVFEDEGMTYHYGLGDVLAGRHLGKLKSVGLCWGFGIGYKDYFRFDVSSDAAIYDFPTTNWKLSLVANDIAGGIRELKQGHEPWEE
ncbi:MAG: PorV/PorQ family protein [candidate division WOR-3 bacterium]|nr:PorV/PorQ family protein [candidate division WOR-3 bacterium]